MTKLKSAGYLTTHGRAPSVFRIDSIALCFLETVLKSKLQCSVAYGPCVWSFSLFRRFRKIAISDY
jgi:hypothetical protein